MSWVGGHNQLWSEDYTEWYTQCVYPWNPGQTYPSHQGAQHLGDGVWPIFDMMPLFLPCLPQTIIPEHGTSQYCNSLGSSSSIALSPGRFEHGHILLVFLSYSHTEIFFSDESSEEIPHSSQFVFGIAEAVTPEDLMTILMNWLLAQRLIQMGCCESAKPDEFQKNP